MNKRKKGLKGFSLAELILAIGIFSAMSSFLVLLVIDTRRTIENANTRIRATQLVEEVYNSILILKQDAWYNIARHTEEGEKHLELVSGVFQVVDGRKVIDNMEYYFIVGNVMRDSSKEIVSEGGTLDPHTRLISIHISWIDRLKHTNTLTPTLYINDWNTNSIVYTTKEDFQPGDHNYTVAVDTLGGETRLQSRYYSDWCNPTLSIHEYDIPGEATPRSVFSKLGSSYLGTRGSATGQPFTKLLIEGVAPPVLTVEGYFSGYNVNDIFVKDNYAFLATTNDSKEVVILDISSLPYTEIGYFNAPGSDDGFTVFVDGNIGYLGQGRYVRSFDLSSYTGSRSQIGYKDLSSILFRWVANVSQIYAKNGYLYAVLNWDWYELAIVNISNPANMVITSQTSVNNQQVYDMQISEDATRAYFGTTASSSERELFIINTSSKSGSRPIIASIEMDGTTIRGISVVEDGKILIAVGTGGEEYKVYNITNEASPQYCGGMNINTGIYDIDSIRDSQTNAFSYIVTGDTDSEFKIIRGGPGGGGPDGYGYYEDGVHTSAIYDTNSTTSEYYVLAINGNIPSDTSMKVQLRVSNSSNMSDAVWIGDDGTSSTYFERISTFDLPIGLIGRYIQYRVFFESDTVSTPLLEELIINYEK